MRRRRKHLEVSTFPFLAVLLCTMGSLILVLLVMDRKSKLAARQKAEAVVARVAEQARHEDEERRAVLRRKREEAQAAWERQRQGLHDKLVTDEAELKNQLRLLALRLVEATDAVQQAKERLAKLRQRVEAERVHVIEQEQTLKSDQTSAAEQTAAAKAAVAAAIANVAKLEAQLAELKAARSREGHTHSVVPYRGKHGDDRRPVYVECTVRGVIFHPDHKELPLPIQPDEVRVEVERHLARFANAVRPVAAQDDRPPYCLLLVRPDGIPAYYDLQPVLKGLRIDFGYEFIDADWLLDFPDDEGTPSKTWAGGSESGPGLAPIPPPPSLHDGRLKGLTREAPQRNIGPPSALTVPGGIAGVRPGLDTAGPASAGTMRSPAYFGASAHEGGTGGPGTGGMPGTSGFSGGWSAAPGTGGSGTGTATVPGFTNDASFPPGNGHGPADPRYPGAAVLRGIRGGAATVEGSGQGTGVPGGSGQFASEPGAGDGNQSFPSGSGSAGVPGAGNLNQGTANSTGQLARAGQVAGVPTPGMSGQGSGSGLWQPGSGGQLGQTPGGNGAVTGALTPGTQTPGAPGSGTGNATGQPVNGGQSAQGPGGNGPAQGAGSPGTQATGAAPGQGAPNGTNGPRPQGQTSLGAPGTGYPGQAVPPGSSDTVAAPADAHSSTIPLLPPLGPSGGSGQAQAPSGKPEAMSRLPLPTDRFRAEPKANANREAPIRRPSRFNDRDWIIYLECQADRVVLYPAQKEFPLAALTAPAETNTLLAAVRRMIERRQSLVAPGDVPYRPEVRFLIRPNSLRTFHMTYPALDELAVPKTRQNLAAEDDVRNVMQ